MKSPRFFVVCVVLFSHLPSVAEIPRQIAYQGVLTDADNNPKKNGSYSITFSIYDTAFGGAPLWSETKSLFVRDGLFTTFLGNTTPFNSAMRFDSPYWLSVSVDDAQELAPRVALASVGYSFRALWADTAMRAKGVSGADVTGAVSNAKTADNAAHADSSERAKYAHTAGSVSASAVGKVDSARIAEDADMLAGKEGTYYTNASNLSSGVIADSLVSSNVSRLGQSIESSEIADSTITRGDVESMFKAPYSDIADSALKAEAASSSISSESADFADSARAAYSAVVAKQAEKISVSGSGVSTDTVIAKTVQAADSTGLRLISKEGKGIFVDSGGNVGIGTPVPKQRLYVSSQDSSNVNPLAIANGYNPNPVAGGDGKTVYTGMQFWAKHINNTIHNIASIKASKSYEPTGKGWLRFYTLDGANGLQEKVTITPVGNVGIRNQTPSQKLEVCGNIAATGTAIVQATSCSSDRRLKCNISPFHCALETANRLEGVVYEWDRKKFPERNFPSGRQIGLIAQDVEKVLPELVHTDKQGYKSLSYDRLTAVLVEAIKEQQKIIETQNRQLSEIEKRFTAKLETMQNTLNALSKTVQLSQLSESKQLQM